MKNQWSLPIGRFSGIQVYIHWTFMILLAWILVMNYSAGHSLVEGGWSLLFVLTLFGCIVLHEFGHALTARKFGIKTGDITLYPIGGIASLESMPEKPAQELLVAIAGPTVNFTIAVLLWGYLRVSGTFPDLAALKDSATLQDQSFVFNLFAANLLLATFNLLPAFPMDGGRVLRALLAFRMDRAKATRVAASVGQLLAIFLVFLGFSYDFWLVFIGLFVYLGAGGEAAFETSRQILSPHTVRDAMMTKFSALHPADPLGKAVELLLDGQDQEFLVIDQGKVVGILLRLDIIRGLAALGKASPVEKAMQTEFLTLTPELALKDIYPKLVATKCSVFPVVEKGALVGVVDMDNIQELIWVNSVVPAAVS
ncbi:MAG: site-2 protease family protein [Bacteroidetes bacterium]|nr:MAG: site-2 protease family protein [Bacteroidota bacterium]PTM13946.1 MAG: site-2 protease family protein [Bacteroidota bacterium]